MRTATDRGIKRSHNEDSHAVWTPDDPAERDRCGVLLVLADGMGGAHGGEIASRITVETVMRSYREATDGDLESRLRGAVEEANRAVFRENQMPSDYGDMGATCTALAVRGRQAWVAHVGDSRAYVVRRGAIRQLTQDHSLVAQLVAQSQLTPEKARVDPRRNVVTRGMGMAESVEVDAAELPPLESGDTLLLCSDGLHGPVLDEEIARMAAGRDLEAACDQMIALANQRGGPDNVTVVLARIETDGETTAADPRPAVEPLPTSAVAGALHPPASARPPAPRRPARRSSHALAWLIMALIVLLGALALAAWVLFRMNREANRIEANPRAESPVRTTLADRGAAVVPLVRTT